MLLRKWKRSLDNFLITHNSWKLYMNKKIRVTECCVAGCVAVTAGGGPQPVELLVLLLCELWGRAPGEGGDRASAGLEGLRCGALPRPALAPAAVHAGRGGGQLHRWQV